MDELLYQYNPWWEGDFDLSGIRPRENQIKSVMTTMSAKQALLLTGLRRVGKTTIMRLVINSLIQNGTNPSDIFYISLDDYLFRNKSILDIITAYRTMHKISVDRTVFLFLDEITYKEDYQAQLKNLIDRGKVVIVASSSSASILRDEKAFLTGRSTTLEIQPLDFFEYMSFKNIKVSHRDASLFERHFKDYMREGGLPEHVLGGGRVYLMSLVDDIIQKDIAAFYGLRDHQILRDYFTLLMERSGKQVSVNKIGKILKISPDTSRRYLDYFQDTFLIHLVPRWGTTNERILSPKKVYACDLAVKHLFIGDRDLGSYFENYVYLQLRRHTDVFYYRENGIEIDFLTRDGALIEAKYNARMEGAQLDVFKNHPAKQKIVVDSVKALSRLEDLFKDNN
ncbi:MAG: ATP-binding protein [Desulfonatronovibrio sp.]